MHFITKLFRSDKQPIDLLEPYTQMVRENKIAFDVQQSKILTALNNFENAPRQEKGGVYIYGPVGRGKTMITQLYIDSIQEPQKERMHFYNFMNFIHDEMRKLPHATDPIKTVIRNLGKRVKFLLLDEFQVTDIGDAMILRKVLQYIFANNIKLITTSNVKPSDLYLNGLQRENFLPAIDIISKNMTILQLSHPTDYRTVKSNDEQTAYITSASHTAQDFRELFLQTIDHQATQPRTIYVGSRPIQINETHQKTAWISFEELCCAALGPNDYEKITQNFQHIFLCNLPVMNPDNRNEARRFCTFIDKAYENKIKVSIFAQDKPENIYTKGDFSMEFNRTVSRLYEMQSAEYCNSNTQ